MTRLSSILRSGRVCDVLYWLSLHVNTRCINWKLTDWCYSWWISRRFIKQNWKYDIFLKQRKGHPKYELFALYESFIWALCFSFIVGNVGTNRSEMRAILEVWTIIIIKINYSKLILFSVIFSTPCEFFAVSHLKLIPW